MLPPPPSSHDEGLFYPNVIWVKFGLHGLYPPDDPVIVLSDYSANIMLLSVKKYDFSSQSFFPFSHILSHKKLFLKPMEWIFNGIGFTGKMIIRIRTGWFRPKFCIVKKSWPVYRIKAWYMQPLWLVKPGTFFYRSFYRPFLPPISLDFLPFLLRRAIACQGRFIMVVILTLFVRGVYKSISTLHWWVNLKALS